MYPPPRLRLGDAEAEGHLQVAAGAASVHRVVARAGAGAVGTAMAGARGGGSSEGQEKAGLGDKGESANGCRKSVTSSILLTEGTQRKRESFSRGPPWSPMPACMESMDRQSAGPHLPTHESENSRDSVPSASPFPIVMVTTICF